METLSSAQLAQLGRLHIRMKKKSITMSEGTRRSTSKGRSAEFSGYREYIPGDDMRYVDWNAYGRLDKLYIKEYTEEREGRVNIFLDTSISMNFGEKLKSTLMAELAQSLAYIALNDRDSVYVTDLAHVERRFRLPRGRQGMSRMQSFLEGLTMEGSIDITEAITKAAIGGSGVTFIISDFMDENFLSKQEECLRYLDFCHQNVVLLHELSDEELHVEDVGAYQLIDSENESLEVRLNLDKKVIESYDKALKTYIDNLGSTADRCKAHYILCSTGDSFDKIIYEDMRVVYDI